MQLLAGISLALPFLGVRVVYSIVSSYSGSPIPGSTSAHNSLAKFNMSNGTWWIYLVMGLLMEYIVVCIYTVVGLKTPTQRDGDAVMSRPFSGNYRPSTGQRSTRFQVIQVPPNARRGYRR